MKTLERTEALAGLLTAATLATTGIQAAPTSIAWDWSKANGAGTSITNALDYSAEANWAAGGPVDAFGVKADFSSDLSGVKYVKVPGTAGVKAFGWYACDNSSFSTNAAKGVILVSDGPIWMGTTTEAGGNPNSNGIMLYGDTSWLKGNAAYHSSLVFCGDVGTAEGAATSTAIANGRPIEIRCDLYAKNANPVRDQPFKADGLTINSGDLTFVAPHGAEKLTGAWDQVKDSPYLVLAGEPHVLCAGTVVTGEGIPEGTFVKRIFSASSIELSAPATETIAANTLTFAAFSPTLTQSFNYYCSQADAKHLVCFMKWRDEDDCRVELRNFQATKASIVTIFDVKEGAVPATTVIRHGGLMEGKVEFGDCRVEFATSHTSYGRVSGLPNAADAKTRKATSRACLVVTNNLNQVIGNFSSISGTVVKEGAGTLALALSGADADYSGAVVVEEGTLVLSNKVAGAAAHIATLAISNAASLYVPEGGLTCDTFIPAPGAIVTGPGTLSVATYSDALTTVICQNGAKVVYANPQAGRTFLFETPVTNVPGTPALWFDASRTDTFEMTEAGPGTNLVTRWRDVRGESFFYATNACETLLPTLYSFDEPTKNHVFFPQVDSARNPWEAYDLSWCREVTGIRSVFKVVCCVNGGGQFLGASPLWRAAENRSYNNGVVYSSVSDGYPAGSVQFFVNGESRDWTTGYAYPGGATQNDGTTIKTPHDYFVPQTVELDLDADHATSAGGFSAQVNSATGRNGNQCIYEMIVYTNALTEAERVAITGYLMQKWQNAEVNYEVASQIDRVDSLAGWSTIGLGEETRLSIGTLTGEGTVEKVGAGEAYVEDLANAAIDLHVKEGTLVVRSAGVTADDLPENPILHLDASKTESLTGLNGDYVYAWEDARGADYGGVTSPLAETSARAKLVPNHLNGKAMVDFGSSFSTTTTADLRFPRATVRSIFSVQDNTNGGGYLFGDTDYNSLYCSANLSAGLVRYPDGALTRGIVWKSCYPYCAGFSGAGATRTFLDGESVAAETTGYSATDQSVSVVTYEPLVGNSIACGKCSGGVNDDYTKGYNYCGGKKVGEMLYYERALSRENQRKIDAYLRKKWFGTETAGYRAATVGALAVDAGATLKLYGGAPITVSSLVCAGTIASATAGTAEVRLADGATLDVEVLEDGSIAPLAVSGTVGFGASGTIRLTGAVSRLANGTYTIVAPGCASVAADANWTAAPASGRTKKVLAVSFAENACTITVSGQGLILLVE